MSRVMQSRRRPARVAPASLRLVASWRVRGDCLRRLGVEVGAASARLVVRFSEGEGFTAAVEGLDQSPGGDAAAANEQAIDPAMLGLNGHATVTETDDGSLHLTDPDGFAMTFGACAMALDTDAARAARAQADATSERGNGDRESSLLYVRLPSLERCGGGRYHLEGGWVEAIEAAGA